MKALRLDTPDGTQSARLTTLEPPAPGPGQVRVALKAASLNHRELWIVRGQYPGMQLPATLGCDGAGIVDTVGDGVDAALVGSEVVLYPGLDNWGPDPLLPAAGFGLLGMPGAGTLAEAICVPAAHVLPKPSHLNFEEAAALPLAMLTAWRALTTKARLKQGETLLLTGVGGGVAMSALKLALAMGAEVYVTSGSDGTLARAAELGARGGFNYRDSNWRKAVAAVRLDVVVDGAPAAGYPNYSRALRRGARVVFYGSTAGVDVNINVPELFIKNITITGTNVGNLEEFRAVLDFIGRHAIRPEIDRSFKLDDAVSALKYLETSHGLGKVVVRS